MSANNQPSFGRDDGPLSGLWGAFNTDGTLTREVGISVLGSVLAAYVVVKIIGGSR